MDSGRRVTDMSMASVTPIALLCSAFEIRQDRLQREHVLLQRQLLGGEAVIGFLPFGWLRHGRYLYGSYLVLGAIGGPVRVVCGNHVGTRLGKVEGGVYHAWLNALGHHGAQHGLSGPAADTDPVVLRDTAFLRVMRMNLQFVFAVPLTVVGAPGLRAHVVLRQDAAGGKDQRIFTGDFFLRRHILGIEELAFAANEFIDVDLLRNSFRRIFITWPLHAAQAVDLFISHPAK